MTSAVPPTTLGYWSCYFLEHFEINARRELFISSVDNQTVYQCFMTTLYLTGQSAGPTVCTILCILITLAGTLALLANITSIIVLRHSMKGSFLQKLLILLAVFDLIASCFAIFTSVFLQVILDNVNRSKGALIVFFMSAMMYSLGRTGSVFLTILVTIERFVMVAYPYQAKTWLSPRRSTWIIIVWLTFVGLINIPWWLNSVIVENNTKLFPHRELSKYPYVFLATTFSNQVYSVLRPFHVFVDFVLPLPLLLLFNGLLFRFIYKWNKQREQLTGRHVREINSAKMFSVVVILLFSCHIMAVIDYFCTSSSRIVYREVLLSIILAVTLNAMANFFIYYAFGQTFRQHFWYLLGSKVLRHRVFQVPAPPPPSASRDSSEVLHENVKLIQKTANRKSDIVSD